MSASSPAFEDAAPQRMVGVFAAPPVPQYRRKQDISPGTLWLSFLVFMGGWILMWYLDVSCLGFDLRDFMPLRRSPGVAYRRSANSVATVANSTARDGDPRDVAADAKKSVKEFFNIAGNFRCPQPRRYTRDEVARHCTADDLWVVIDGNVLDLSEFINQHPGGLVLLDGAGGQDMATAFARFHHPSSVSLFSSFCIGRIAGS
ncbi:Cytochrome b5-like Heme/Steroid binding domain containing protein [Lotmaria passim]